MLCYFLPSGFCACIAAFSLLHVHFALCAASSSTSIDQSEPVPASLLCPCPILYVLCSSFCSLLSLFLISTFRSLLYTRRSFLFRSTPSFILPSSLICLLLLSLPILFPVAGTSFFEVSLIVSLSQTREY
jgi:hypothetical protein